MKKTGLDQTVSIHFGSEEGLWRHASELEHDPRWALTQHIVDSPQFSKSPRLAKFLLYIVAKFLAGRQSEVTEQQIGVHVFGRPHGYRTVDDNIVRSYARQLRKRLDEYFAGDGVDHAMRIEIPLGGYLPAFTRAQLALPVQQSPARESAAQESPAQIKSVPVESEVAENGSRLATMSRRGWPRLLAGTSLLLIYSAVLVWLTSVVAARGGTPPRAGGPADSLWVAMLQGAGDTYIVPPDAGLNLVEDLSRQSVPLAEYLRGGYLDLPLPGVDAHSQIDLRTQQLTSFMNLQLIATLVGLSEYTPARVFLRFPRDLRFDDLKHANAIIIGSSCSNPWAVIAESATNFQVRCSPGMQGATVVNLRPQPGEEAAYTSHWNEPTHETYSVISYLPNLSGYGHLLMLGGLDAAGTQAAGEALLRSETIAPVLQQATRPDGSIAAFEVLLRSTSIQANATDTHVIASRIH